MRTEKLGCTVHVHSQRGRALGLEGNASKDPIGVVFAARLPLEGGRGCGVEGIVVDSG